MFFKCETEEIQQATKQRTLKHVSTFNPLKANQTI